MGLLCEQYREKTSSYQNSGGVLLYTSMLWKVGVPFSMQLNVPSPPCPGCTRLFYGQLGSTGNYISQTYSPGGSGLESGQAARGSHKAAAIYTLKFVAG